MPSTDDAPVNPSNEIESQPAGETTVGGVRTFPEAVAAQSPLRAEQDSHEEANSPKPDNIQKDSSSSTKTLPTISDDTSLKTVHDSTSYQSTRLSSGAPPSPKSTTFQPAESYPGTTSNPPPIITYPEYLYRSQKPPPLVTFDRLLYAFYGAAGLTAAVYGTRKFVVDPMLSTLTDARHAVLSTAMYNVQQLNDKLSSSVSHVPPTPPKQLGDFEQSETGSVASDPTELFHRDTATQTTPSLPHTPTASSINPWEQNSSFPSTSNATPLSGQAECLTRLRSNLQSLLDESTDANATEVPVSDSLSGLKTYLDSLTYSGLDSYPYDHNSGGDHKGGLAAAAASKSKEGDEIAKFKTEIRSLKGALLSARNFPAGASRPPTGYVR